MYHMITFKCSNLKAHDYLQNDFLLSVRHQTVQSRLLFCDRIKQLKLKQKLSLSLQDQVCACVCVTLCLIDNSSSFISLCCLLTCDKPFFLFSANPFPHLLSPPGIPVSPRCLTIAVSLYDIGLHSKKQVGDGYV